MEVGRLRRHQFSQVAPCLPIKRRCGVQAAQKVLVSIACDVKDESTGKERLCGQLCGQRRLQQANSAICTCSGTLCCDVMHQPSSPAVLQSSRTPSSGIVFWSTSRVCRVRCALLQMTTCGSHPVARSCSPTCGRRTKGHRHCAIVTVPQYHSKQPSRPQPAAGIAGGSAAASPTSRASCAP
jgi:hypothetical protein